MEYLKEPLRQTDILLQVMKHMCLAFLCVFTVRTAPLKAEIF
jgi:hypothetical protein